MSQHTLHIFSVCLAERQNHAREMVKEADLSQWDALVIMSGDGLLYEVKTHTCTMFITKNTTVISKPIQLEYMNSAVYLFKYTFYKLYVCQSSMFHLARLY